MKMSDDMMVHREPKLSIDILDLFEEDEEES
jgi:hypothetical protein